MSSSEKTQDGDMVRVKVRSIKQFLEHQVPKHAALQHALLYENNVLRVVVEKEVPPRMFGLLLGCAVAVGADLGPFAKGPGAKVFYVSGSGDEDADTHRLNLLFRSFDKEQQERLATSFTLYHRGMEGDDQLDLTTEEGRGVLMKSIPTDTKVIVIDYLPAFFPTETISHRERKKLDDWLRTMSKHGVAVVVFDVETKKRTMLGENRAKNTIYLDHDVTAPTQFGGGHLIRRSRVDDADSMLKCISFWYTELDGWLEYGFSVPDDEDRDAPHLTKRLERQIKVERMLRSGMSQKTIAAELRVHAATICRDFKEIDIRAAKDEKAKAKSSGPQLDSGRKVGGK